MLFAPGCPIRMTVTEFIIFFCVAHISASTIKGKNSKERNQGSESRKVIPLCGIVKSEIKWEKYVGAAGACNVVGLLSM